MKNNELLTSVRRLLLSCCRLNVICSNFTSTVRSAWPEPLEPAPTLRMMQMALLTALMTEDNILLLVKDVFTFSALTPSCVYSH